MMDKCLYTTGYFLVAVRKQLVQFLFLIRVHRHGQEYPLRFSSLRVFGFLVWEETVISDTLESSETSEKTSKRNC